MREYEFDMLLCKIPGFVLVSWLLGHAMLIMEYVLCLVSLDFVRDIVRLTLSTCRCCVQMPSSATFQH